MSHPFYGATISARRVGRGLLRQSKLTLISDLEGGFHGRQIKGRLFPFVYTATKDEGAQVRVNFGSEPFKYQWSL